MSEWCIDVSPEERRALAAAAHARRVAYRERVRMEESERERQQAAAAVAEARAASQFCGTLDPATLERARQRVLSHLPPLYQSLSVAESKTLRLHVFRLLQGRAGRP